MEEPLNELAIQKPSTAGTLVHGTRAQIIVHSAVELIECSKTLGSMLYGASRFNFKSKEDAECHALMCLMTGQDPLSCVQEVDGWQIIAGQRQMKYRAMANRFLRVGGKIKQIVRTPLEAKAELTRDGQTITASFTWEEAKVEPYCWNKVSEFHGGQVKCFLGDGTPNPAALKDNWSTPRRRMQMLWARVITDTIASVWADIIGGAYIVNEMSDDTEDDDIIDGEVVQKTQQQLPPPEPTPAPVPVPTPPPPTPAPEPVVESTPQVQVPTESKRDQTMRRLKELHGLLDLENDTKTWQQLLNRYGVASASHLNEEQADSLLGTLIERWEAKKLEDDAKSFSFSKGESAGQNP